MIAKLKSQKEIQTMIDLLTRLRKVMPRYSMLGDDNHEGLDFQIQVLTDCLGKDYYDIEEMADRAEEEKRIEAFDWVLGNLSEDITEEDEVKNWEKKR